MSQSSKQNCRCDCFCPTMKKKIVTHQVCTPNRYHGPANLPPPTHYLYWSTRPIITYTSTSEQAQTWNLKRRTPGCEDIYYQEMYDRNGNRVYWKFVNKKWKNFQLGQYSSFSLSLKRGGLCIWWRRLNKFVHEESFYSDFSIWATLSVSITFPS